MSDVTSVMMEAETAFNDREWDLAIDKYKEILGFDPQNEEACTKLAELYAIRGLISNVVETYFNLMDILEQKQNYDMAVEIARWIMKVQPENDKARMKTILIFKKKGDMEEVVNQSLQLARLYIELNQGDQSILLLKNAQEIAPDNLDIGLELAEMYISHGHIQEGTNQYRKIANAYLNKGNYEKATEAFRRMKVVIPEDPQLLFTLGNLYMNLGKLNEAESEFRAILRHNLNHTDALMSLGEVCQKKGQFRDAILAFNKILSINPQDEKAKERLGELYHAQGATSEAVKCYLEAANAYQYSEDLEKAISLYQRVLSIDKSNPTACRELTNLGAPLEADGGMGSASMDTVPGGEHMPHEVEPLDIEGDESDLDIDLDMDVPSLEEIAGIEMPSEEEIPGLDTSLEFTDSMDEFMPGEMDLKSSSVGAVPSAFGAAEAPDIDIRELKKGMEGELTYGESEGLSPDLMYDDQMNIPEEDMGFGYDDQEINEEEDFDEEEFEEDTGGRRSLRRKDDDDGGALRRGLSKKKSLNKRITSKRAGVVSTASSVKKPSLPKRGLASRGKGLFRRRRQEEQFEEEIQPMEFPEPGQVPQPQIQEGTEEFFDDFEAPPAFDDEGFAEAPPMDGELPPLDGDFGDMGDLGDEGGVDDQFPPMDMEGELPPLDEGFGDLGDIDESVDMGGVDDQFPPMDMEGELPPLDEGFGDLEEMSGMSDQFPPMDMEGELPPLDEGFGDLEEMSGMNDQFPPMDMEGELPSLDEGMEDFDEQSQDQQWQDSELMPQPGVEEPQEMEMEPAMEDLDEETSNNGPGSGLLLGKKKKKPLRSLFGRKKKEFTGGKKLTGEKLLGGRKFGGDGQTLGQKRLLRRSHEAKAEVEEMEQDQELEVLEPLEPQEFGTPSAFGEPADNGFGEMESLNQESDLSFGSEGDEEASPLDLEMETIPDFEAEFASPPVF